MSQASPSQIVTDGFIPNPAFHIPESANLGSFPSGSRLFDVYLPPDYNPSTSYPIVYHLGGLGSTYDTYSAQDQVTMDAMIAAGEITPFIIILPDGQITADQSGFEGVWYVNSDLNGLFEDYIVQELIPYIDAKYNQKKDHAGNAQPFRAIMGQSMGGYGSLFYGIKHQELFGAFAGDGPTSFWVIYTDLASPNGNPMYTFNKLAIPDLNCYKVNNPAAPLPYYVNSNNGGPDSNTFSIFSWSAAFSPDTSRCYPYNVNLPLQGPFVPPTGYVPGNCSAIFDESQGGFNPAFASSTPDINNTYTPTCPTVPVPTYAGDSLVPNPSSLVRWPLFDPYVLLNDADKEVLKRQLIYLDAGNIETVNSVGARFFSDKLTSLNIDNEYILYGIGDVPPTTCPISPPNDTGGTHGFCTDPADSPCQYRPYGCLRFSTNFKLFSGKFAENGYYAPDINARIMGNGTIRLSDNAHMIVKNIVAVATPEIPGATTTMNFKVHDTAQIVIGGTHQGALQIGNSFGKAQLVKTPKLSSNTIDFSLTIDGPQAMCSIDQQGFLGFAVGVNGNQTVSSNYWAMSTLANTRTVTLAIKQGALVHNQIYSSLNQKSSLLAFGNELNIPRTPVKKTAYNLCINPQKGFIYGGGNMAKILDSNYIHPTVITESGTIEPGGIRHDNLINPTDPTDNYPGDPSSSPPYPPNPIPYFKHIGSKTFYRNLLDSQILTSSAMLFAQPSYRSLPKNASVQDIFRYLTVKDYLVQPVKSAPFSSLEDSMTAGFITNNTINRSALAAFALSQKDGLGIKLIPTTNTILKAYDLNP